MKEILPTLLKILAGQIDWSNLQNVPPQDDMPLLSPGNPPKSMLVGDIKNAVLAAVPALDPTILKNQGALNFNGDWNTYTTPGIYTITPGTGTPLNSPPASYQYGQLWVIKSILGTFHRVTQVYISDYDPNNPLTMFNWWVRQTWNISSDNWTPWMNLNPPPLVTLNAIYISGSSLNLYGTRSIGWKFLKYPYSFRIWVKRILTNIWGTNRQLDLNLYSPTNTSRATINDINLTGPEIVVDIGFNYTVPANTDAAVWVAIKNNVNSTDYVYSGATVTVEMEILRQ